MVMSRMVRSAPGRLNLWASTLIFGWLVPADAAAVPHPCGGVGVVVVCCAPSLQMPGDERTVVIRDIQPGHLKYWFTYVAGAAGDESGGWQDLCAGMSLVLTC